MAGLANVATLKDVAAHGSILSVPYYVRKHEAPVDGDYAQSLKLGRELWQSEGHEFLQQMESLLETLDTKSASIDRKEIGQ